MVEIVRKGKKKYQRSKNAKRSPQFRLRPDENGTTSDKPDCRLATRLRMHKKSSMSSPTSA